MGEEEEQEDEEMVDADPPKVELTAEEKKQWFRKPEVPDLAPYALNTTFTKFSLPEKDEGLDDVTFEWQKGDKCKEYVRQWIRDRKCTTRIEDLQPSDWFTEKAKGWSKALQGFHTKATAYKQSLAQKAANKAAKAAAKETKKKVKELAAKKKELEAKVKADAKAKKQELEAKKKADAEAKGDLTYVAPAEEIEEDAPEEEKKEEVEVEEEEAVEPAVDYDKVDVFGTDDIFDIGGGEPLFSQFAFEDWTMMSLRFEMHLLTHAFRKDVNDADRPGMILEHLPFYYQKYFKKTLNAKFYGVETMKEVLEYIRDTVVTTGKNQIVEPLLPNDMESFNLFVMLTEECRRDRHRRVDLGEDAAKLKFSQPGVAGMSNIATVRPGLNVVNVMNTVRPAVVPAVTAVRPAMAVTWPNQVRPAMVMPNLGIQGVRPAMMVHQPAVRQFMPTPTWAGGVPVRPMGW